MRTFVQCTLSTAIAVAVLLLCDVARAETSSTHIKVLDGSGLEGIPGAIVFVNPGVPHASAAYITNTGGEAVVQGLQCEICTVSVFDPHGLFSDQTTEFSSSKASFSIFMKLNPVIDIFGDPQAISLELVIYDSKGKALVKKDVVIRPAHITLENNQLSIQTTDLIGGVRVILRPGNYTVGVADENTSSEVNFEIATASALCSKKSLRCIVAKPRSVSRTKRHSLQLVALALP